jgi:hypothetical protein
MVSHIKGLSTEITTSNNVALLTDQPSLFLRVTENGPSANIFRVEFLKPLLFMNKSQQNLFTSCMDFFS